MTAADRRIERAVTAFRAWRQDRSSECLDGLVETLRRRCRAADVLDAIAVRAGRLEPLERLERAAGRRMLRHQLESLRDAADDGWERTRFLDMLDAYIEHVEYRVARYRLAGHVL